MEIARRATSEVESGTQRRVLVIEDDLDLSKLLAFHLQDIGCDVRLQSDGRRGLDCALSDTFGLVVLDLTLPSCDGIDICRTLRLRGDFTPILMLTARSAELDRVYGLEAGADDYLTKPFSILEFMARVKAVFRRAQSAATRHAPDPSRDRVRAGDFEIDLSAHDVTLRGKPLQLTAREFDLLLHFARNPGQVFSRQALLDQVWDYRYGGYEHTVNSHINRLRAKIEDDPRHPDYILTVWGVGYKLADPPVRQANSDAS